MGEEGDPWGLLTPPGSRQEAAAPLGRSAPVTLLAAVRLGQRAERPPSLSWDQGSEWVFSSRLIQPIHSLLASVNTYWLLLQHFGDGALLLLFPGLLQLGSVCWSCEPRERCSFLQCLRAMPRDSGSCEPSEVNIPSRWRNECLEIGRASCRERV